EDLLPRSEVKFALRDGDNDLAAHDLALQMSIGVILAGTVVMVMARVGIERRQIFQPDTEVAMEAALVVVDKHTGGNVHRVYETEPLLNTAASDHACDLWCNVHEGHATRNIERQVFRLRIHSGDPPRKWLRIAGQS